MLTVVETVTFLRRSEGLLTESERIALVDFLATNPEKGDLIPGTGGVRKLRFGARDRGKRGGLRVIYYVLDEHTPLFLLTVYGKNEQDDISAEQKKAMRAFAAAIKAGRK